MQRLVVKGEDVLCSNCEGHGNTLEETKYGFNRENCTKCHGAGKLDWVTNAMGAPDPPEYPQDTSTVMSIASYPSHSHGSSNNTSIGYTPNYTVGSDGETIRSSSDSLKIESEYLELSARHLELTDEVLESLADQIEQKLKEREE